MEAEHVGMLVADISVSITWPIDAPVAVELVAMFVVGISPSINRAIEVAAYYVEQQNEWT